MLHPTLRPQHLLVLALTVVAAAAAFGCGGGDREGEGEPSPGPARSFAMGVSSLPRELNADAYADAFDLAGDAGEMVLIRRAPPWAEFLPGGTISTDTADTTAAEIEAVQANDLDLFFAIDPTDPATGRDRLASLPQELEGRGFEDTDVRSAFLSYAEYVAINYEPAYLALAVEINLYIARDESRIESFASLYAETYDRLKEVAPDTQITVTLQYEDLQSLLPTEDRHFADWGLLERFDEWMDVVALSTYPGLVFSRTEDIPANYYSQLQGFTEKSIVIADTGFPSAPSPTSSTGSPEEQTSFLERIVGEAQDMQMPFVIWLAAWDPAYAEGTAFDSFRYVGLLQSDGTEKPAWSAWMEEAGRSLEAE